jgi:hypothetical protein
MVLQSSFNGYKIKTRTPLMIRPKAVSKAHYMGIAPYSSLNFSKDPNQTDSNKILP